jgi:hypothetical protein
MRAWPRSIIALGLVVGCGGAQPHTSTVAAHEAPPSRWTEPLTANDEPWRVTGFARIGETVTLAGTDSDGTQSVFTGEARARIGPNDVTWAHDVAALDIVGAAPIGDAWYFAISGGAIMRSTDGFLGALSEVTRATIPIAYAQAGDGVMSLVLADGSHVRLDASGLAPFVPVENARVISVALASPTHGAAVVAPGRLLITTDGHTYAPRDIGPHVPIGVSLGASGSYVVHTLDGWLRLRGETTEPLDGDPQEMPAPVGEPSTLRLWASQSQHQPFDVAMPPGPSGRVYRYTMTNGNIVAWDPTRGVVTLPPPADGCSVSGFGDALYALCGDVPVQVFVSDDFASWRDLGSVVGPMSQWYWSADGSSLLVRGHCSDPGGWDRVCWHDGNGWRERSVGDDITVYGVWRDRAIVTTTNPDDGSYRLGVLDLRSEEAPVPVTVPDPSAFDPNGLVVAADGTLTTFTHDGEGALTALWIGPLAGPLTQRLLPDAMVAAGMADALRGLAIGTNFALVSTTSDGGVTWTPAAVPSTGDATEIGAVQNTIVCSGGGCTLRDAFYFGPAHVFEHTSADAQMRFVWTPMLPFATDDPTAPPQTEWDCTAPDHLAPLMPYIVGGGWANVQCLDAFHSDDGYEDADADGDGSCSFRGRWGGVDARGTFSVESSTGPIPAAQSDTSTLMAATRTLALVVQNTNEGTMTLVTLRPGQAPTALAPVELPQGNDVVPYTALALPLDGGGLLARIGFWYSADVSGDVIVHVGPDGHEIARRIYVWPASIATRMQAVRGAAIGIVTRDDGGLVFYDADGAAQRLGDAPENVGACGSARPTVRMLTSEAPLVLGLHGYEPGGFSNVLAYSSTGLCVESVAYQGWGGPPAPGVPIGALSRGALHFVATSPEIGTVPLDCHAPE